ncbi:hypothetical protein [Staphylococcus edaphicus]|nr:hypothetical protein [Staphylococcus edaphicus]
MKSLKKKYKYCRRKIEQMDKAEGNNQESQIAKALIKLAGGSDD